MGRERTSKFPPKTLVSLQKAEVFLATYVDGQQYSDSRLVVKVGNNLHYLHPEIGGGRGADATLKPPAGWLKEQILNLIDIGVEDTDTEIPEDEVSLSGEAVG